MKKAVVLLSGGLDSATVLYIAKQEGFQIYTLSFDYGQRHKIELEFAQKLAKQAQSGHLEVKIDSNLFSGSALVNSEIEVPKNRIIDAGIPITYVPGRNILFLAHALSLAESIGACDIFLGVNALDYSGYPDCRPKFIDAFARMANLGTKSGIESQNLKIQTPLIKKTKAQIIQLGMKLGVDYSLTNSCYDPLAEGKPCKECDSCILRARGFAQAGYDDPLSITKQQQEK